jgi:DNA-binding NarL/FixJ family response regulator
VVVVGEAKNGNEALELARRLEWDVAILDYSMPGRSGLELIKEIKREHPKRPVLILSMHPEELHATRVLQAGGAGYANKKAEQVDGGDRKVVGEACQPAWLRLAQELAPDAEPCTGSAASIA